MPAKGIFQRVLMSQTPMIEHGSHMLEPEKAEKKHHNRHQHRTQGISGRLNLTGNLTCG